ncbi:Endo-1,4-beta-xylanase A precursor [Enhygromyxa salina]|uniref:Endo-1,4-beta-xylanase A n=2 Tax=Enhygromyxa salina TaxID=215803 RepID=A0A0C2D9L7_9BACT|nr:Endo-1,4-beta-xylanase A precursor [Enhygromyxa salina]
MGDTSGDGDGDGDGDPGDGDGDTGDGDGDGPDVCEDTQLPPRNGAEIVVSPGAPGMVMVGNMSTTLRQVVSGASEGDTILLEDGTYTFPVAGEGQYTGVYVTTPNITLRSVSGDPSAVVLDSAYGSHGGQSALLTIDAPGVVIADITVQRSIFHLIHLWTNGDDVIIHNVHLIDGGQQFIKASTGNGSIDNVEVSCSSFVMTPQGRDNVWGYGSQNGQTKCYTGGIDTHDSTNWVVRDSYFEGIYCDAEGVQRPAHGQHPEFRDNMTYNGGLAEHAIHMWDSVAGTGHVIARNRIVNCARGISIGFNAEVHGSQVINNMVFSEHAGSGQHDVGISIERGIDTVVAHNSVYMSHPNSYASGIEYRWGVTSNLTMHGNLTNRMIRARDGATADLSDNVTDAEGSWFVDGDAGDLHLVDCSVAGTAALSPAVSDDFDAQLRGDPTTPGADDCM